MRIVVIGAGAIGAASALALAEAGAEVVVVDPAGVAGETSSRCEGNILVSDKGPGAEAELAIVANRAWRVLAERLDADRGPGQPAARCALRRSWSTGRGRSRSTSSTRSWCTTAASAPRSGRSPPSRS